MSSLLFAIEVLAILAVIHWARKNDHMPLDGGGSGLLAMRDGDVKAQARKIPRWNKSAVQSPADGGAVSAAQPRWKPRPLPARR